MQLFRNSVVKLCPLYFINNKERTLIYLAKIKVVFFINFKIVKILKTKTLIY